MAVDLALLPGGPKDGSFPVYARGWRYAGNSPSAGYVPMWSSLGTALWVTPATVAALIDHGLLLGLTDDDHTQYALLAGRSGGQTLIGGTASGNKLTLQANSSGGSDSEVEVKATTTGATGAQLAIYQDSSSPANNDVAGIITGYAKDANGTKTAITAWNAISTDVTAGAMSSAQAFRTLDSNTTRDIYMDPNWMFGPNDDNHWNLGLNTNRWAAVHGVIVNAGTGFRVNNAATNNAILRGNGTNFVEAATIDHNSLANRTHSFEITHFVLNTGTPAEAVQGANVRYSAWAFDAASLEGITCGTFQVPRDFVVGGSFLIFLHWTNLGAGSGDVRWRVIMKEVADAGDLNSTASETDTTDTITAPAQNIQKISQHSISFAPSAAGVHVRFIVARSGADVTDTLGNDAGLLKVQVVYTRDH